MESVIFIVLILRMLWWCSRRYTALGKRNRLSERTLRWRWNRAQWHLGSSSSFPSAEKVQWGFKWSNLSAPASTLCSFTSCLFWSVAPCFGSGNVWTNITYRLRLWAENSVCVPHSPGKEIQPMEGTAVPWGHWHMPCTAVLLGWGRLGSAGELLRLNAGIWVSTGG